MLRRAQTPSPTADNRPPSGRSSEDGGSPPGSFSSLGGVEYDRPPSGEDDDDWPPSGEDDDDDRPPSGRGSPDPQYDVDDDSQFGAVGYGSNELGDQSSSESVPKVSVSRARTRRILGTGEYRFVSLELNNSN